MAELDETSLIIGKLEAFTQGVKESHEAFKKEVKEDTAELRKNLCNKIDNIAKLISEKDCSRCPPAKNIKDLPVLKWQVRGIFGSIGIIFAKIFFDWWNK